MNCYSCQDSTLLPTRLAPGLPVLACEKCGGVYIDLLTYRGWSEECDEPEAADAEVPTVETADSEKALLCQRCRRIMLKFRISGATENYVDICTTCDDAWLDKGEWQLLKQLQLQNKLTEIATRPWQKLIREQRAADSLDQRYKESLGEEEFTKLKSYVEWLSDHPKRREIENYVRMQKE